MTGGPYWTSSDITKLYSLVISDEVIQILDSRINKKKLLNTSPQNRNPVQQSMSLFIMDICMRQYLTVLT